MGATEYAIFASWALSLIAMVSLILMHAGKGSGFSDAAAASLYASRSASAVMEKNLNRLTNVAIAWFVVSLVLCLLLFPQGVVGY